MVPFERDHKFGYRDAAGTVMIKPQYADAKPFCEGLAAVGVGQMVEVLGGPEDSGRFLDGKYGYINPAGKLCQNPQMLRWIRFRTDKEKYCMNLFYVFLLMG